MILKVIIIDDEQDSVDALELILSVNEHVEIVGKTTDPAEGINLIREQKPDVLFLDIEMPQMSGFQLLEALRNIDFEVIFATAYEHYALRAIKSNAVDYIVKPISISEVNAAIEKVLQRMPQQKSFSEKYEKLLQSINAERKNKIKIPTINGFEFVGIEEILRVEAEGPYTYIYLCSNGRLMVSRTIKEVEKMLDGHDFFRSHRSHLISIKHVKRFDSDSNQIVMADESRVPLARRRKAVFNEIINNN